MNGPSRSPEESAAFVASLLNENECLKKEIARLSERLSAYQSEPRPPYDASQMDGKVSTQQHMHSKREFLIAYVCMG